MAHKVQNFRVHSGDDQDIALTYETSTGGAFDLNGAKVRWGVWRDEYAASTAALLTKYSTAGSSEIEITDSTGGAATAHIYGADTDGLRGVYYHESKVVTSTGGEITMFAGHMTVSPTRL